MLNLHGIPKPVDRAFELLHHLGTDRLSVLGTHNTVDVWVVRGGHRVTILMTNHAQPRRPISTELVQLELTRWFADR